ncbi:Pycsar system effector family protein [Streptomyces sp. NPDC046821]|uniref:Pycsar system effector family protein n=1 Tax=Streptomyces sp. NPDC046821 TaxID=3154702 RepID=UPI0033DCADE4
MNGQDTRSGTRLLAEIRAEIGRADSKAAVLVGAIGMAVGLLGGLLAGRGWDPARLSLPGSVVWWAGIAALAASLLALLLTVVPRYGRSTWEPGLPLGYFGDIRRAADAGHLAQALETADRDPAPSLMTALAATSRIAARKNLWLRVGLAALGSAALLLPTALLLG